MWEVTAFSAGANPQQKATGLNSGHQY